MLEARDAVLAYGVGDKPHDARPLFERYVTWSRSAEGRSATSTERDELVRVRLEDVSDTARFRAMIAKDVTAKRTTLKLDPGIRLLATSTSGQESDASP